MRLPAFEIERYFAGREFDTPYLLCASDCESLSIGELCALDDRGLEGLARLRLGYTQTQGDPELRARIAELYETIDSSSVLVTAGGVEAIHSVMTALVEPGDRVVVVEPNYQCLAEVARGRGASVDGWALLPEEGWHPSLERLERLLRRETRAVVANFPHNPSGAHPDLGWWGELVALLEEREIFLVSDEAYRFSEYRDGDGLVPACDLSPNAVSLGLMSKSFGMPGLRIAWLATHERELLARAEEAKDYTTICASAPSEYLASLAIARRQPLLAATRKLVTENLEILKDFMARWSELFDWVEPAAGPISFPRLRAGGGEAVEALCEDARAEAGVLLLPGRVFGRPEHLRIGFGRRDFQEALARFEDFLARRD